MPDADLSSKSGGPVRPFALVSIHFSSRHDGGIDRAVSWVLSWAALVCPLALTGCAASFPKRGRSGRTGGLAQGEGEYAYDGRSTHLRVGGIVFFALGRPERLRGYGVGGLCFAHGSRVFRRLFKSREEKQQGVAGENETSGTTNRSCGSYVSFDWSCWRNAYRYQGQCLGKRSENVSTVGSVLQGSLVADDAFDSHFRIVLFYTLWLEQRHQPYRWTGWTGNRLYSYRGFGVRTHGLCLRKLDHFRLPPHQHGSRNGRTDRNLRRVTWRLPSLPLVQRTSGGSVHGGYGVSGHWRTCGDNRIDDSSTLHLGHRGRNLRYRGGVGHTASSFFQVDGQPHLSNGSHSPPFRAERLEGNEGGNPFLDSFTTLCHRGFGHAETTLV